MTQRNDQPPAMTPEAVIQKMTALMQEQPDGRYLSATDGWNELLAWLRGRALAAPQEPAKCQGCVEYHERGGMPCAIHYGNHQPAAPQEGPQGAYEAGMALRKPGFVKRPKR